MNADADRALLNKQMQRWARDLRIAAEYLEAVAANGTGPTSVLYDAAKATVDQVADEMYGVNDAMARAAWEQVRQQRAAS